MLQCLRCDARVDIHDDDGGRFAAVSRTCTACDGGTLVEIAAPDFPALPVSPAAAASTVATPGVTTAAVTSAVSAPAHVDPRSGSVFEPPKVASLKPCPPEAFDITAVAHGLKLVFSLSVFGDDEDCRGVVEASAIGSGSRNLTKEWVDDALFY